MNPYKITLVFLCLIVAGCSKSNDGWTPLFNGKDFEGWHTYGTGKPFDGWSVENEELKFDFKARTEHNSSYLVTDKEYTNFELSLEWKVTKLGNSGVFWGVVEDEQFKHPYETGPEIQILDDDWTDYIESRGDINRAGSLYGLLAPSAIVSKPADEWNHYLIHIDHNKNLGYVKFNGQTVLGFPIHGAEWEEMIANSGFAKWPSFGKAKTGLISLQEHGNKVSFRNIKIKELPNNSTP